MRQKLNEIISRHEDLHQMLADPDVVADRERLQKITREYHRLSEIVEVVRQYDSVRKSIDEDQALLSSSDGDLAALAREEIQELSQRRDQLEEKLRLMLVPQNPRDIGNALVEIRAGTGGAEASLFAADLFRMYSRFAERKGWRVEVMSSNPTEIGGFKEIIFSLDGSGVFGQLRLESGVHRVQRIPMTEASGRIHTSAASVVVLPEPEEVEVQIDPGDLRIDVFRSSGPGGQSVNTTDSAVRITHVPTGIVATCQDEKSQHKNRTKAMKVLRVRLLDRAQKEQDDALAESRRSQVGSGDRSAKIRTYNFPQNRITDHRIKLTLYRLEEIMDGDLGELIETLRAAERKQKLEESGVGQAKT
jgi:peptide chain release factor 1